MGQKIKLKGISKRGKDRINSHGETFELIQVTWDNISEKPKNGDKMLIESLNNTWRGQKWLGWLEVGREVEIVK